MGRDILSTPSLGITFRLIYLEQNDEERIYDKLSTPSLGITYFTSEDPEAAQKVLSTPSLGITYATAFPQVLEKLLSTPSLGITKVISHSCSCKKGWTFNSLSRDHIPRFRVCNADPRG